MLVLKSITLLCVLMQVVYCGRGRHQSNNESTALDHHYHMISKRQVTSCPYSASITCDKTSPYSSLDGSCNNLNSPYMGKANTPLKRLLPAEYADGIDLPKTVGADKTALPNPRTISKTAQNDNKRVEVDWTHIFATFGQFLTHDIAETAVVADSTTGERLDCPCTSTSSSCFSITLPTGDSLGSCLKFPRSSATVDLGCTSTTREQLNIVTSSIDGSHIYGSGVSYSNKIRSFVGGQLLTTAGISSPLVTTRPYLPFSSSSCSATGNANLKCFQGGEDRTSENLGLSGIHTLFLREHNRIAASLQAINPKWTDERLFQETRKIVIAILQHIVYSQFLPGTIGVDGNTLYGLNPTRTGYFTGYNTSTNIQLTNEFATAAFRYGHSTVQDSYQRFTPSNVLIDELKFSDINFKSDEAYNAAKGGLDTIFMGLLNEQCGKSDLAIGSILQNSLLDIPNAKAPIDLAAYNINRGRDHGIPGYIKYVQRCQKKTITSFADLVTQGLMTQANANIMSSLYKNVADIDLWIGGLAEIVTGRGDVITSPTFTCIIGEQFRDLKYGDRFYYENAPNAALNTDKTAFTAAQLTQIKKISAARLICNNFDVTTIQKNIFFTEASRAVAGNAKAACSTFATMDLTKWVDLS